MNESIKGRVATLYQAMCRAEEQARCGETCVTHQWVLALDRQTLACAACGTTAHIASIDDDVEARRQRRALRHAIETVRRLRDDA